MTTCIYAGNILAADSRATYGSVVMRENLLKCCHCHTSTDLYRDNSTKLLVPTGLMFEKEPILACAHAGAVNTFERFEQLIKRYKRLDQFDQISRDFCGRPAFYDMRLLVVTPTNVYSMNWGGDDCEIEDYDRNACVSLGSGGMVAESVFQVTQHSDAVGAVHYAGLTDRGTGGPVNFVDFEVDKEPTPNNILEAPALSRETILTAFREDRLNVHALYASRVDEQPPSLEPPATTGPSTPKKAASTPNPENLLVVPVRLLTSE